MVRAFGTDQPGEKQSITPISSLFMGLVVCTFLSSTITGMAGKPQQQALYESSTRLPSDDERANRAVLLPRRDSLDLLEVR